MDQLGIPPDEDSSITWSAVALAGAVGFAGVALWRFYLSAPAPTPTSLARRRPNAPSPKARKPAPYVPGNEAEDLLASAGTKDEQKKLGPLMASLAPTGDHTAQIKAARAALFYVQDANQWAMMRRTGVLSAMVRLLVSLANRAAQRGDGNPTNEEAAVLMALVAALSKLCRSPDLREAMATPELVRHAVYLLHTHIVDSTKADLVAMLDAFVRLSDDRDLRHLIVVESELGPVLVRLFMQTSVGSGEDIIKHTADALVPFVAMEEDSTRALLLEHDAVGHALGLFNEGRAVFAKRKTPLALLSLLNSLSGFVDAEECEQVLSKSLAQHFITELRKNQKVSFRQHLPAILSLLRAFLLEERKPEHNGARQRFQDYFLDEQEDGTTGVEQVASFLKDDKLFTEAAEVLLGLSVDNPRLQASIKENEEAMATLHAAKDAESHPGSEPAELLLSRLGSQQ